MSHIANAARLANHLKDTETLKRDLKARIDLNNDMCMNLGKEILNSLGYSPLYKYHDQRVPLINLGKAFAEAMEVSELGVATLD